jgi:hypothetical protein
MTNYSKNEVLRIDDFLADASPMHHKLHHQFIDLKEGRAPTPMPMNLLDLTLFSLRKSHQFNLKTLDFYLRLVAATISPNNGIKCHAIFKILFAESLLRSLMSRIFLERTHF